MTTAYFMLYFQGTGSVTPVPQPFDITTDILGNDILLAP